MGPDGHEPFTKCLLFERLPNPKVVIQEALSAYIWLLPIITLARFIKNEFCPFKLVIAFHSSESSALSLSFSLTLSFRFPVSDVGYWHNDDKDLDKKHLACAPSAQAAHPQGCFHPRSYTCNQSTLFVKISYVEHHQYIFWFIYIFYSFKEERLENQYLSTRTARLSSVSLRSSILVENHFWHVLIIFYHPR